MALKCVLAMGALLFNICVTAQGTCTNPDTKVLILGGGMSGVAAARKLYDSGWTNFIILEARDKVGGRMRTENFAGVKVEVGANWIHGVDDTDSEEFEKNPIWNLAQLSGLQRVLDRETIVVYDGQNVTTPSFDAVDGTLDTYYTKVEALSKPGGTGDKSMREALSSVGWNPQTSLQRFADWYKFDSDQATRPDNVSLYGWAEESTFTDFGVSNYIVVDQRGYAYLVEYLGQSFLAKALHLNTTVSEIEYQENCVCANVRENGQQKKYCGNYGIVTFSIGVLQSKTVTFTPSLPQWKVSAINQVIIPLYLKVFVWFNETFWNTSVNFIGRVSEDPENYTLFVPIGYHIEGQPSVLLAILTGATAYRVAEQNVSVTKQELLTALRSVYGNFRAVINDILVPDWATNSLYYGAYGQPKVGYSSTTADTIADPINTLYFSGEATSQDYIGSVHGAYLAGVETASSIISAGRVNTLSFVAALLVLLNMAAM